MVAAALKAGHYSSAENVFVRARQEQLRVVGDPVSPMVLDAMKLYQRSIERGAGGPALKEAFRFERLAPWVEIPEWVASIDADLGLPIAPWAVVVLCTWWLVRGIEAAGALAVDLVIDGPTKTVSWNLPVSKRRGSGS